MPSPSPLLWSACVLGVAAVAVLRFAWSRPRRTVSLNAMGWAALAGSVAIAWRSEGAWGVSVAALGTMGAALVALAAAGLRSPRGKARASDRKVGMLPEAGEPKRIGRRVVTFLLVVVGGLVVSIGLAVAARGLGSLFGWSEANANVVALYIVPLAWAVLASVLLMQVRRRDQVATLLICSLPAVPFLTIGVAP